jgi:hypothetical protein
MMKLNPAASVVEYNSARVLIACLGYAMYRKSDSTMHVVKREEEYNAWRKSYPDDDIIASLMVDMGAFSQTLDLYTGELRFSHGGEELVDFAALLSIITRWVDPNWLCPQSPYHGRGRSQSFRIRERWKFLLDHKDKLKDVYIELM